MKANKPTIKSMSERIDALEALLAQMRAEINLLKVRPMVTTITRPSFADPTPTFVQPILTERKPTSPVNPQS